MMLFGIGIKLPNLVPVHRLHDGQRGRLKLHHSDVARAPPSPGGAFCHVLVVREQASKRLSGSLFFGFGGI
jgi:hypothetical protein